MDAAVGQNPFVNFECQVPGHQRRPKVHAPKRIGLAPLAQQQDVGKTIGDKQRGLGRARGNHHVGRSRRSVINLHRLANQVGHLDTNRGGDIYESLLNGEVGTVARRQRLRHINLARGIFHDNVGERSSCIHRNSIQDASLRAPDFAFVTVTVSLPSTLSPRARGDNARRVSK
ncbi:unannotated protein [freshwater metagenome]|uniref:Unannotated protein n=1 Tax=freshwater metagenome TaxID=449393 RepID=A0A6J7G3S0_9ZZZZ